jgi:hypothetical protein
MGKAYVREGYAKGAMDIAADIETYLATTKIK